MFTAQIKAAMDELHRIRALLIEIRDLLRERDHA
jgi:hypothetical protein